MSTLDQLGDPFVTCRVRRHLWDEIPDDGGIRRQYTASRTVARLAQRCTRCGTVRFEAWNTGTGEILFAEYRYPKGYLLDPGKGVSRSRVRVEFLDRELYLRSTT